MTIAIALALLTPPTAEPAQAKPKTTTRAPADAAREFTLDGMEPPVEEALKVEPPTETEFAAEPVPAPVAGYTLDTPIAALIADPRAREVLDRDLPGLSTDKNLVKFQSISLRRFQPLTGGQLTDKLLTKVAEDLAVLDTAAAPAAPKPTTPRKKPMVGR